jgi:hypothetical protein
MNHDDSDGRFNGDSDGDSTNKTSPAVESPIFWIVGSPDSPPESLQFFELGFTQWWFDSSLSYPNCEKINWRSEYTADSTTILSCESSRESSLLDRHVSIGKFWPERTNWLAPRNRANCSVEGANGGYNWDFMERVSQLKTLTFGVANTLYPTADNEDMASAWFTTSNPWISSFNASQLLKKSSEVQKFGCFPSCGEGAVKHEMIECW